MSIETIKERARGIEVDILKDVAGIPLELLDGKKHPCPCCGGKDRFRLIDAGAGAVLCNQCFKENNGDFIAAVAWMKKADTAGALKWIENYLSFLPPPGAVPDPPPVVTEYFYNTPSGETLYKIVRLDKGPKEKTIRPFHLEKGRWKIGVKSGSWDKPFFPLLYNAYELSRAKVVFFVEGEKCADIVAAKLDKKDTAVTTISGGSNNWKHIDYFKDVIEGKHIYLFLDNDQPGEKAGQEAVKALKDVSLSGLYIVRFPDGPKGYDVGDWMEGKNFNDLEKYIGEYAEKIDAQGVPLLPEEVKPLELAEEGNGYEVENQFDAVTIADVKPENIEWLWENKIPLGMVTLLAGRGGEGKSYFSAYLASRISRGGLWPDGAPVPLGCTVYLGPGEDPLAQVMRPRLDTLGADTSLISEYRGVNVEVKNKTVFIPVSLKQVGYLKTYCQWVKLQTGFPVKMVVIDPVSNFLDGTKENSNSEIRELFKPLVTFAKEENIAVLLISHFRKGLVESSNSIERVIGSAAFTTAVRSAWFLYANKADKNLKVVVPAKYNILVNPTGLELRIMPNGQIEFTQTALEKNSDDIDAEQALFQKQQDQEAFLKAKEANGRGSRGPAPETREAAEEWLKEQLTGYQNGREVKEIKEEAMEAGFNWRTVQRAAEALNIKREKLLTGWNWSVK